MTPHKHSTHPQIIARLKRAHGHLAKVIAMLDDQEPCPDIAQQLFAVEKAITNAKRTMIHDHVDHCLASGDADSVDAFKTITKYL
ncbi:metal-sensing transcriptional repressor [Ruegeria arenilitoris]|jgi:DNA-binding FrmR family transcriptional regulator|uniref:Copper-sensing transcriptional repressor CsoR n=1 Tax=Ruegeria arenilitoris TaxID=1173585 RepID=A0A238KH54_9RHOB|nr:metal-sensing transcriptional repressor [Ruegeria arenilitoris]SMX42070.1 Copper-sensing transcriptional repressor CsoR [Ruegeria arenilitoris]